MAYVYVSAGIAGLNFISGSKSAKEAKKLNAQSLAFAMEQYEDFKNIYGGIERNLSNFYTNLTPEFLESQGLEAQEKQYQLARDKMETFFAVNEIPAGAQADLFTKGVLQNERDKARIRADAPFKTAKLKQGFLQLGLNQKANAQQLVSSTLNRGAENASNRAAASFAAAGTSLNAALDFAEQNRIDEENIRTANTGSTEIG